MFWKSIYKEEQFIVIKISGLVKKKSNFKKTDRFSVKIKKKDRTYNSVFPRALLKVGPYRKL
jgi:hypothetical protein